MNKFKLIMLFVIIIVRKLLTKKVKSSENAY